MPTSAHSPNEPSTYRRRGRPRGRKPSPYPYCLSVYLTAESEQRVEGLLRRFGPTTSRAALIRALLELALPTAEQDPAVLLPLMGPRLDDCAHSEGAG